MEEIYDYAATQAYLREILPNFEVCARRAIEGVLELPTLAPRGFAVTPSFTHKSPVCCFVQCWNSEYSLTLSVGIDNTDLDILVPGAASEDMALDTLGEVANVIAGRVLGIPGFADHFGRMAMTYPLFSNEGVSLKQACAVHGVLVANSTRLFLGFTIVVNDKESV